MTKREIIAAVLEGKKTPYVPWSFSFTLEAEEKLTKHFETDNLEALLDNHLLKLGSDIGFFAEIGNDCFQDMFGVVWDRSIDKDIGNVKGCVLPEANLKHYRFPDPMDERFFQDIPDKIKKFGDRYRVFQIGFSLFERAWSLRGMENLLMDFYDHPDFVHELFNAIADYNIKQIKKALEFDIDAAYFGDDWGQQRGLIMGPALWHEFIFPALEKMYGTVREAGKKVFIHSCGDVDELFDSLYEAGVNCFNPFQPEVMEIFSLMKKFKGRLTFHGGLSTQKTLPFGTVEDVENESQKLLRLGREGSYIFSPAHAVEGDVPLDNMLAFIKSAMSQEGYTP